MNFSFVEDFLEQNKNDKLADFSNSLTPGAKRLLGVNIPVLRSFAKTIDDSSRLDFIFGFREDFEEDLLLKAIVLGLLKEDIQTVLKVLDFFKDKVSDWMVCDILCNSFKIAKTKQSEVFEFLNNLANSPREFDQRIVAVMTLSHFINDNYIDKCFELIKRLDCGKYYTDMGVGWFIATAFAKFPDKTFEFLTLKAITKEQFRLAVKKAQESLRVSKSDKIKIRALYARLYLS